MAPEFRSLLPIPRSTNQARISATAPASTGEKGRLRNYISTLHGSNQPVSHDQYTNEIDPFPALPEALGVNMTGARTPRLFLVH